MAGMMTEEKRVRYWPRRTPEQAIRLHHSGWFPFPELNEADNDMIFQARLAGFGSCFPAYPDAETQAMNTFASLYLSNREEMQS